MSYAPIQTTAVLASLLLLAGCGDSDEQTGEEFQDHDDARLCLVEQGDDEAVTDSDAELPDDRALTMHVGLFVVLHGEGPVLEKSCSVDVDGDQLHVDSYFEFGPASDDTPQNQNSTPWRVFTECDVPPLDAGDYDVVHGDSTNSVTVPDHAPLDCGDEVFDHKQIDD